MGLLKTYYGINKFQEVAAVKCDGGGCGKTLYSPYTNKITKTSELGIIFNKKRWTKEWSIPHRQGRKGYENEMPKTYCKKCSAYLKKMRETNYG